MNGSRFGRYGEGVHRGSMNFMDRRLCFQAHDNYFECLDLQKADNPNKFLCVDQLYAYETYCTDDFIFRRKFKYNQEKLEKKVWTQNELDLINAKRNFETHGKYTFNLSNSYCPFKLQN